MQTSTSPAALCRSNLFILGADILVLTAAVAVMATLHTRAVAFERLLTDSISVSTRAQAATFGTEGQPMNASVPRTLTLPEHHVDTVAPAAATNPEPADPVAIQAQLREIQQSLDWYEAQITRCREKRRDPRWYEEHRDALLARQKELATRAAKGGAEEIASLEGY